MECVGAVVEHALGVVMRMDRGLDAEVAEHGVRFPATEELDGVGVNAGAEECGGAAGAERAGANEGGGYPGGGLKRLGRDTEGFSDFGGFGRVPAAVECVPVVVAVDGGVSGGAMPTEVLSDPAKGLCRAEDRIIGSAVANLFATHSVLLVKEFQ